MTDKETSTKLLETIADGLEDHRLTLDATGKPACSCGWWTQPLLDSVHRLHQADQLLSRVVTAVAQVNAEHIADALTGQREQLRDDAKRRTHAIGLLLQDSGDITPMGVRMLEKIWEPAEENAV